MGSLIFDVLRQGIWASLTGGWYYDPRHTTFVNTVHLYIFLFFLCLPMAVELYFPHTAWPWMLYITLTGLLFLTIKMINCSLHHMFDTTEGQYDRKGGNNVQSEEDKRRSSQKSEIRTNAEEEGIEMQVLNGERKDSESQVAVTLQDIERGSLTSSVYSVLKGFDGGPGASTIDLKVDVHRKDSSDSSDGMCTVVNEKADIHTQEVCVQTDKFKKSEVEKDRKEPASVGTSAEENISAIPARSFVDISKDVPSVSFVDEAGGPTGRLSERSRQYSVSVTLGKAEPVRTDPGPSRSLQLDEDLSKEQTEEKGLLFWKQKWENTNEHSRSDSIIAPSDVYRSDTVYSVEEQADEEKQSSLCEREDFHASIDNIEADEVDYGDGDNVDSPLLASKGSVKKTSSLEAVASSTSSLSPTNRRSDSSSPQSRKFHQFLKRVSGEKVGESSNARSPENVKSISSPNLQEHLPPTKVEKSSDSSASGESLYSSTFSWLFSPNECGKEDEHRTSPQEPPSESDVCNEKSAELPHAIKKQITQERRLEILNRRYTSNPVLTCGQENKPTTDYGNNGRQRRGTCSDITASPSKDTAAQPLLSSALSENAETNGNAPADQVTTENTTAVSETTTSSSNSNNEFSALLPVTATASSATIPVTTPMCSVVFSLPGFSVPPVIPLTRRLTTACAIESTALGLVEEGRSRSFNSGATINLNRSRHRRPRRQRPSLMSQQHFQASCSRHPGSSGRTRDWAQDSLTNTQRLSMSGKHMATAHEDTSEGAVHLFQDENGEWMTYAFDPHGNGAAVPLESTKNKLSSANQEEINKAFDTCTTFVNSNLRPHTSDNVPSTSSASAGPSTSSALTGSSDNSQLYQIRGNENGTFSFERIETPTLFGLPYHQLFPDTEVNMRVNPLIGSELPVPSARLQGLSREIELEIEALARANRLDFLDQMEEEQRRYRYYTYKLCSLFPVRIFFDRLQLLALFDYNRTDLEISICVLLSFLVSMLGALMLYIGFYKDITLFLFCFVLASCQYSLLKSVQPDAASPTHGFNKIVAFSRPVYFIICATLSLSLHAVLISRTTWPSWTIYGQTIHPEMWLRNMHNFLVTFLLYFPVIFAFGMFPQVNTFLMYFFEQIDMHLFGGNAVISLKAAIYCVLRSILAVVLLFGFAYAGLNEPKSTQHILFSIFISLLVIASYHLSRSPSDPAVIWDIISNHLLPFDEGNFSSPKETKKKVKKQKPKRVKEERSKRQIIAKTSPMKETVIVNVTVPTTADVASDGSEKVEDDSRSDLEDPLPAKLQHTIHSRLQSDLIVSLIVGVALFIIHRSTVFSALQPELNPIMWTTAVGLGFILHYFIPQMRKQLPWLCIAKPLLLPYGIEQFEPREPSRVTNFEMVYLYFGFIERNIIYPITFVSCITSDGPMLTRNVGPLLSAFLITLCGLKCLRLSFSHPSSQYVILLFTVLLFQKNYLPSETFVVDYFLTSIIYFKLYDLLLKAKFVMTYIAPWQITWGSAFHAFAQPFSLPHTGMLFAQIVLSSILSSPLYPFLGSAIFLTSYPRPLKFWERDYNTRRVDHSNTKMSSHLERNLGGDDNNLNSIFYEHLTRSLQHSLCGDLSLGRWGEVTSGDCFVLASDYLNCMIHIVELGNGLVTFQMRGLEFRGTYCQQREVEAITEGIGEDDGCCCCKPGHLPNMLAFNVAFSQRWLAWEVIGSRYVVEGYSISDNSAASMLQVFDFRKILITYYVKSIIYYVFASKKLEYWVNNSTILESLQQLKDKNFADLDPVFNMNIDEDFDYRMSGITRNSFCNVYANWIRYCNNARESGGIGDVSRDSNVVTLCLALSLLGRRALGTASHNTSSTVEFFLYGLHALFKGDFRIASVRDEWVFTDMDLLRKVVAPAIRMAVKLHQDHFMAPDEFESPPALYSAIAAHDKNMVISHEGDPMWRKAVLSGKPSLLALRRVIDDGSDDYKVIMLNKRYLSFRLIKLNRECVRGLWAGQQQELVYLRNRNPERGSIQNAKQVLRNIINSSCDQPIGYPIFVSPLTTSYLETNEQIRKYLGGPITIHAIRTFVLDTWRRIRHRCLEGCSSGGSVQAQDEGAFGHDGMYAMTTFNMHTGYSTTPPSTQSLDLSLATNNSGTITRVNRANIQPNTSKPSGASLVTLAGLLSPPSGSSAVTETTVRSSSERKLPDKQEEEEKETVYHRVRIIDPVQVHDGINQGRLIDVIWPDEVMRQRGGRNFWKDWVPEVGMEGQVVHRWVPNHPNPNKRSTFDRTILLVKIDDKYVPISESGVQDLGAEV